MNFLGRDAIKLSKHAFAGDLSPADLILKHSAWPVYSSLVSRRLAHNWYLRNVSGAAGSSTREIHSPIQGELFARRWRSCRLCAIEQTCKLGTAHWMVIHQLPGIYHCPFHGQPLDIECEKCGQALGGAGVGRLPGEPCKSCGGTAAVRSDRVLTSGEIELAKLYVSLLKGEGPELDPVSRHFLLKGNANSGEGDSCRVTKEQVISAFGCSTLEEFGRYLNVEGSPRALNVALAAGSNTGAPAPFHLVVAAIALSELPGPNGSPQKQTNFNCELREAVSASHLDKLPAEIAAEVLTLAANQKIPPAAVIASLAGESGTSIEARGIAPAKRLARFLESLPLIVAVHFRQPKHKQYVRCLKYGASHEDQLTTYRARIEQEIQAGAHNRTLLLARCGTAYKWALTFDRDWLNALLPAWIRRGGRN